jgi:hypothetical protein
MKTVCQGARVRAKMKRKKILSDHNSFNNDETRKYITGIDANPNAPDYFEGTGGGYKVTSDRSLQGESYKQGDPRDAYHHKETVHKALSRYDVNHGPITDLIDTAKEHRPRYVWHKVDGEVVKGSGNHAKVSTKYPNGGIFQQVSSAGAWLDRNRGGVCVCVCVCVCMCVVCVGVCGWDSTTTGLSFWLFVNQIFFVLYFAISQHHEDDDDAIMASPQVRESPSLIWLSM